MPLALCPTTTCTLCHKRFQPGDRVLTVNVIDKLGVNPNNMREEGAWFVGDFELTHLDCANRVAAHSTIIHS